MFLSVADYKASIYYDDKQSFTDGQLEDALSFAIDTFYSRTNRHEMGYWLEPRELTLLLSTTGLPLLLCPYPVLELVSVSVDGTDVTDEVIAYGHFLLRNGSTWGEVPDAVDEAEYSTVSLTAKFGDPSPKIVRGEDLSPTVPGDVKHCIFRMAMHSLKRHGITQHIHSTRDNVSREVRVAVARDPDIQTVLTDWTVTEISRAFDFR